MFHYHWRLKMFEPENEFPIMAGMGTINEALLEHQMWFVSAGGR